MRINKGFKRLRFFQIEKIKNKRDLFQKIYIYIYNLQIKVN